MRSLLLLSALAAAVSCGSVVTAPDVNLAGLPAGLEVDLVVEPTSVPQRGPFDVTLRVRNTTTDTLRVTTAHGCLATPHVMRDARRFPFEGSWYGCTAAITTHVFPPGETRTRRWEMRAELYAEHPGDVDGVPAPRGEYVVRVEFDSYGPAGVKPFIERALRVD